MKEMANIEGNEIVIRIPIDAIPQAAQVAFDEEYGEHSCRVDDSRAAAEAIVRALNDESEDGTTLVHSALDRAVINAYEQGESGFERYDDDG